MIFYNQVWVMELSPGSKVRTLPWLTCNTLIQGHVVGLEAGSIGWTKCLYLTAVASVRSALDG